MSFQHKDWALQCDNTRTCRAVGYQSEGGESEPVSMRLTREAGPDTPVLVDLQVSTEKASPASLHLKVGALSLPGLKGDTPSVPAAQVPRLLQELLKNEEATVTAGKDRWVLSLAMSSQFTTFKMDEAQGRVGTPGALVRKARPEASVLPLPAPVIKAVTPLPARKGDAALAKPLRVAALDRAPAPRGQCNGDDAFNPANVQVYRLTDRKVLLSVPCGMGAYNFSSLLWVANDRPPYKPEPLQDVDGDFDPASGMVHSAMKGRGIGDCWWVREWQFDGEGFVLRSESWRWHVPWFCGRRLAVATYVTR